MTEHFITTALLYLALGGVVGIIAGIYGIGGGLIIVPALVWFFHYQHSPALSHEAQVHLAVGTSRAILVIATIRAIFAHYQHHIKIWDIYGKMMIGVMVGVLVGTLVGYNFHTHNITRFLGFALVTLSLPLFFLTKLPQWKLPGPLGLGMVGVVIGILSGMFGLAGGTYTMLFLAYCHTPLRQAVLVSLVMGFTIALTGMLSTIPAMEFNKLPLYTSTFIYWPAWFFVSLGSLLLIPVGVSVSYRLNAQHLRHSLASLLVLVGICLLFIGPV